MPGFQNQVDAVEERGSERMNVRTRQPASLAGVADAACTMNATDRSATGTIAAHEGTDLQPIDHARFLAALDTPPTPTDRLQIAFARYRETITGR